ISYRLTSPEREAPLTNGNGAHGYVELANPIAADKTVLRHTILIGLLEAARANARYADRQQVFEIGSVYYKEAGEALPQEPAHLGILITGGRHAGDWTHEGDAANVDFYDLKGIVEELLHGLHVGGKVEYV